MHAIVDQLCAIYDESVENLRKALSAYLDHGTLPDEGERANGLFAYPELRVTYGGTYRTFPAPLRAFARLSQTGTYVTTDARHELIRVTLVEQLGHSRRSATRRGRARGSTRGGAER